MDPEKHRGKNKFYNTNLDSPPPTRPAHRWVPTVRWPRSGSQRRTRPTCAAHPRLTGPGARGGNLVLPATGSLPAASHAVAMARCDAVGPPPWAAVPGQSGPVRRRGRRMMSQCRWRAVGALAPREARLSGPALGHLGRVDSRGLGLEGWCWTTEGAAKLSGQRRDNPSHPPAHVSPAQLGPSRCRTPTPTPIMSMLGSPSGWRP